MSIHAPKGFLYKAGHLVKRGFGGTPSNLQGSSRHCFQLSKPHFGYSAYVSHPGIATAAKGISWRMNVVYHRRESNTVSGKSHTSSQRKRVASQGVQSMQ